MRKAKKEPRAHNKTKCVFAFVRSSGEAIHDLCGDSGAINISTTPVQQWKGKKATIDFCADRDDAQIDAHGSGLGENVLSDVISNSLVMLHKMNFFY